MSLNFANNLEDLAEEIGKWRGMSEGIEQPEYMDSLITRAFEVAEVKFNMAAAFSADEFDFAHMYEYGTRGVGVYTGEDGNLYPLTITGTGGGRLWESFLVGGGGRKMITFAYLPANQPNPPKTSENTGVDSDEVDFDKLAVNNGEEYIWYNKAETVEENKSVFIKVREANLLFVPMREQPRQPTNRDIKRGFAFRKAVTTRPGKFLGGAGQFTAFFAGWWSEEGSVEIEREMLSEFNNDVTQWRAKTPPSKRGMKNATMVNIIGAAEESRKKTRKQWEISARDRQGKVKVL